MKITRKQLRVLVENTVANTLEQLEKSAMPVMDLIVGYYSTYYDYRNMMLQILPFDLGKKEKRAYISHNSFLPKLETTLSKAVASADKSSLMSKISELFTKYVRNGKIKIKAGGEATAPKELYLFLYHLTLPAAIESMGKDEYLKYHDKYYTTIGGPGYRYRLIAGSEEAYHREIRNLTKNNYPLTFELMKMTK